MSKDKKAYAAPEVRRIVIRPDESVLANCKDTTTPTPCSPTNFAIGS